MKLIIAIVQDEDASRLINNLMSEGYRVTKLATTGGFLRSGNTTLLVGVEDDKLQHAMSVIERSARAASRLPPRPPRSREPQACMFPTRWRSPWVARPSSCWTWNSLQRSEVCVDGFRVRGLRR